MYSFLLFITDYKDNNSEYLNLFFYFKIINFKYYNLIKISSSPLTLAIILTALNHKVYTVFDFHEWLYKALKIELFKCRHLTEGEIRISRSVFGDLIDYSKVLVMNQPYLPWQPVGILMAPNGCIHMKDANFCHDFSKESLSIQALFIHEMAHIYQYQHQVNVLLKGAILQIALYASYGKYNPYHYTLEANKKYWAYNIEQQGDIAKDIFLKKIPNIILNSAMYIK